MWNAIVCTCQNRESANSFRNELLIRQKKRLLHSGAVLLAVDDPKPNIGSGSAALNALLCVSEHLAANEGLKFVSGDALYNVRILILLLGTTFPFSPCGHGFMPDSTSPQLDGGSGEERVGGNEFKKTEVTMNIDRLVETLNQLCRGAPPGVWVSSTDMILKVPHEIEPVDVSGLEDTIGVLTLLSKPEYAMLHGACRINEKGEFAQIIHSGGKELVKSCIRPDGLCEMLAGIVYMSPRVAEIMLGLHTLPPLDACTYVGLDNGAQPLSLSLFFDILLCLTTEIERDDYVTGAFKSTPGRASPVPGVSDSPQPTLLRARALLWKALRGLKMRAVRLKGVEHDYLRHKAADVLTRYLGNKQGTDKRVINSLLTQDTTIGSGSVLINCNLQSPVAVGSNCFLSGLSNAFLELQASTSLSLRISDNLTVQEIHVTLGGGRKKTKLSVVVIYGVNDDLTAPFTSHGATFCNRPWAELFSRTGIHPSELWLPNMPQTLLNAKLYVAFHTDGEVGIQETLWLVGISPNYYQENLRRWRSAWRISLAEILKCVDCDAEFSRVRDISFEIHRHKMKKVLEENQPVCLLTFFSDAIMEHRQTQILQTLDKVAEEVNNPLIVCRIYACIADVLAFMAGPGGIRAGPAANLSWRTAFNLLEKGDYCAATRALAAERANWIENGPDRIIRASRHYERAGQILTRKAVATARNYISGTACAPPEIGQPITVTAPARVDMAGGWTDTPPQAYEFGGSVVTLALTINNGYPIKATGMKTRELKLVLIQCSVEGVVIDKVECTQLGHMADYFQPHAPVALLKAAFICANIVEFPSTHSLKEQLETKYGCGFQLQTTSNVPQGSGLGTSSILGGVIMAALWRVAGWEHSRDSLIHAVLHLEQLLTTGGGWQDQCGGLYGGVKISQSQKQLPVHITTKQIEPPSGFLDTLTQHLLLVYTGKTRLARNLLQDVLRNWHSRDEKIVQTMKDLVDNAHASERAFESGNLAEIGKCLDRYQKQKLVMAPGSMPKIVDIFIEKVKKFIHGCSFAGAGGGGFLTIVLKDSAHRQKVKSIIDTTVELNDFVIYDAAVDKIGMQYSM